MKVRKILVVGGAGYIGSHMAKMLTLNGDEVIVLDNLSTGHKHLAKYGELVVGDVADLLLLETLFSQHDFDAVIYFAASSLVGESINNPAKYYRNNIANTLNVLDVMRRFDVNHFIFSSTAAIFGEPESVPIDEAHPKSPINPYGSSKLMVEMVLKDYAKAYGLNSVALRYFNACGADPDGELGECHEPETHLIPLVLQSASGRRKSITVFGRDYDTLDGTCVRDYVHVNDLCTAHALALDNILDKKSSQALQYNLGNGNGFTVQQVIDVVKNVVSEDGCKVTIEDGPRREGDPAVLVADATLAILELDWAPQYSELETIVRHAWNWEKKLAQI